MLSVCDDRPGYSRREFLRIGTLGLGGLSDRLLLLMCGEMGRTPKIEQLCGRNHWGNLGPLVLAGGGLPMGQIVGRSTANGGEPAADPSPCATSSGRSCTRCLTSPRCASVPTPPALSPSSSSKASRSSRCSPETRLGGN